MDHRHNAYYTGELRHRKNLPDRLVRCSICGAHGKVEGRMGLVDGKLVAKWDSPIEWDLPDAHSV